MTKTKTPDAGCSVCQVPSRPVRHSFLVGRSPDDGFRQVVGTCNRCHPHFLNVCSALLLDVSLATPEALLAAAGVEA